jgi:hypothetical protein
MFIPDPDLYTSRIPDTKKQKKRRGEKFVVLPFFIATIITKLKLILFCSQKYSSGSGIRNKSVSDPRSRDRKAPQPGSVFATLVVIGSYCQFKGCNPPEFDPSIPLPRSGILGGGGGVEAVLKKILQSKIQIDKHLPQSPFTGQFF